MLIWRIFLWLIFWCFIAITCYSQQDCGSKSEVLFEFYKEKDNFIPSNSFKNPFAGQKVIKAKFVIINSENYENYKNNSEDIAHLKNIIHYANTILSNLEKPLKPQKSICGSCYISNSGFQLSLIDIIFLEEKDFISTTAFPGQDSILHIFVQKPFGKDKRNGSASLGGSKNILRTAALYINLYGQKERELRYETARVLLHELGHNFSLKHLYSNNMSSQQETCNEEYSDYLLDIFNSGKEKWCPDNNPDWSCEPTDPKTYCTNNIMDHRMWGYLSPMQLGIMHRASYIGDIKNYIYPPNNQLNATIYLDRNETWDFPMRLYQDVVIPNGITLIVKCTIEMPVKSKIRIEEGGKLIIDGGCITSYNDKSKWGGVVSKRKGLFNKRVSIENLVILKNAGKIKNVH